MVLKEEVFKTEDGKIELKARQLSFAGQMRLESKGKDRTLLDLYKECTDNPALLENLNTQEGLDFMKLVSKVNGWEKKSDEEEVFPKPTQ